MDRGRFRARPIRPGCCERTRDSGRAPDCDRGAHRALSPRERRIQHARISSETRTVRRRGPCFGRYWKRQPDARRAGAQSGAGIGFRSQSRRRTAAVVRRHPALYRRPPHERGGGTWDGGDIAARHCGRPARSPRGCSDHAGESPPIHPQLRAPALGAGARRIASSTCGATKHREPILRAQHRPTRRSSGGGGDWDFRTNVQRI